MIRRSLIPIVVLVLTISRSLAAAQGLTAAKHGDPVPAEVPEALKALLADGGVHVTSGAVTLDFWWMKQLALKPGGAADWSAADEGTLVGVVKLSGPYRDIRGHIMKPGVYTLRYGVQPANGDHLGVSPFRDFLLVSPAEIDTNSAPAGHDGTVDLSKRAIGGSHPAVWSLDPPVATDPPLSTKKNDAGHEAVIFEVPTSAGGTLKFGLILIGKIEA